MNMVREIEPEGAYGAQWSLSDFYDDFAVTLGGAVGSGEAFCAHWGAKKEIHYARVMREVRGGPVTVEVSVHSDDAEDLLDTLIWDAAERKYGSGAHTLAALGEPEGTFSEMLDACLDVGVLSPENCYTAECVLPRSASFAEVVAAIDALEVDAYAQAQEVYTDALDFVRDQLSELAAMRRAR